MSDPFELPGASSAIRQSKNPATALPGASQAITTALAATTFQGIEVEPFELEYINRALAVSDNPEEDSWRWANAYQHSRLLGKPLADTYQNLEAYNLAFLRKSEAPKTATRAIADSVSIGAIVGQINDLGNLLQASGGHDEGIMAQIEYLEAKANGLADNVDNRWLITEALKAGAQSVPFMVKSYGAGLLAAGAGAILAPVTGGLSATAIAALFKYGSGVATAEMTRGTEYLRLIRNGVDHDTASAISTLSATIQGGIEVALGVDASVASLFTKGEIGQITGRVAQKIFTKNILGTLAARSVAREAGTMLEEGVEEGAQELVSKIADYVAAEVMERKGVSIAKDTFAWNLGEIAESAKMGALVAPIFGAVVGPIQGKADYQALKAMQQHARDVDMDTFTKEASEAPAIQNIIEAIPEDQRKGALETVWKNEQEKEKKEEAKKKAASSPIARPNGALYTQEQARSERPDGTVEAILKAGNPVDGERYGYLRYDIKPIPGGSREIIVSGYSVKPGYESIGPELIGELAAKYPGIAIGTNESSTERVKSLIAAVSEGNPRGKEYGAQYYENDTTTESGRAKNRLRAAIISSTPRMSPGQIEGMVILHEAFADRQIVKGKIKSFSEYMEKMFSPEIASTDNTTLQSEWQARKLAGEVEGQAARAGVSFDSDGRALVYISKNGNFRSWGEESFHIFRRHLDSDDLAIVESHYGVKAGQWTRDAEEAWAQDGINYLSYGTIPHEGLRGIFEWIGKWIVRLFKGLDGKNEVAPEIKRVMDGLFADKSSVVAYLAAQAEQEQSEGADSRETMPDAMAGQETASEEGREEPDITKTTYLDPTVDRVQEVPIEKIHQSEDVPNFKEGANDITGTVKPLKASRYIRLGTAPIVLWERLSGRLEIITGRHRLDLARRLGETSIPAQIRREADGFTKAMAASFDAEANIRDGQGSVRDYANYFRNTEITRDEASSRGLLSRDEGREGFAIGKYAKDGLYSLYRAAKIGRKRAAAIAEASQGDEQLQSLGIKKARALGPEELFNYVSILAQSLSGGEATQADLFGSDDSLLIEAEKIAKEAAAVLEGFVNEKRALEGARRLGRADRAAILEKYGVKSGDEAAIQARLKELEGLIEGWDNWTTDPRKISEIRTRLGLPVKEEVEVTDESVSQDTNTPMMFERDDLFGEDILSDAAAQTFGLTTDPSEAGYILSDGRMLDFSGKNQLGEGTTAEVRGGTRRLNHESIVKVQGVSSKNPSVDFMKKTGAVRVDFERGAAYSIGIPSFDAAAAIAAHATGSFTLHIDSEDGELVGRKTIPNVTPYDIASFYDSPTKPETLSLFSDEELGPRVKDGQGLLFEEDIENGGPLTEDEIVEVVTAYGSEEKYREALENVISGTTLGRRIGASRKIEGLIHGEPAQAYKRLKRVDFTGKRITGVEDLACLFALSRNPMVEVFQVVYLSDIGEVLAHSAVTSGLVNKAKAFSSEGPGSLSAVSQRAARLGATSVYVAHNHPSGNAIPSPEDIALTKWISKNLGDMFKGHVVTDHTQYAFIDRDGIDEMRNFAVEIENFDKGVGKTTIRLPEYAAKLCAGVLTKTRGAAIAHLNAQHRVIGWNYLLDKHASYLSLKQQVEMYGASVGIVVTNDEQAYNNYCSALKTYQGSEYDVLLDVVLVNSEGAFVNSSATSGVIGGDWDRKKTARDPMVVSYNELKRDGNGQGLLFESDPWIYKSEQIIAEKMNGPMPGQQILKMLQAAGVRSEELKWTGLDEYLATDEKLKPQEVREYIAANKIKIVEVAKGSRRYPTGTFMHPGTGAIDTIENWLEAAETDAAEGGEDVETQLGYLIDISGEGVAEKEGDAPKYGEYVLPGGANYREVLFTLPLEKTLPREAAADKSTIANIREFGIPNGYPYAYKSPHWDEPNVLAHMRLNDRTDNQGRRMLFIEEIQSDWHQEGRKEGYGRGQFAYRAYRPGGNLLGEFSTRAEAEAAIDDSPDGTGQVILGEKEGVPNAPFKKTWHEFVFKNALLAAARDGYEALGWTTGEQQSARYDLGQVIDHIRYRRAPSGTYSVGAINKWGNVAWGNDNATEDEIAETFGKDVARKIAAGEGEPWEHGHKKLSGLDLKVGGEGMKGFYDKILVDYANELGKKWGVKVEEANIGDDASTTVHYMPVTDAMRAGVSGGMMLFETIEEASAKVQDELYARGIEYSVVFSRSSLSRYYVFDFGGRQYRVRVSDHAAPPQSERWTHNDHFLNVKSPGWSEDFRGWISSLAGANRYTGRMLFEPNEGHITRSAHEENLQMFYPKPRGGWTSEKVLRALKSVRHNSAGGAYTMALNIVQYENAQDLLDHTYYHGTAGYIDGAMKPSIVFSERKAENIGGGGYGQRYWGISLSKSKRKAEAFSGSSNHVTIYPVLLKKTAKVITIPGITDAADIEGEHIAKLWDDKVDAVWIGGGEEELLVLNPKAIVVYKESDSYAVFGGFKSENFTLEKAEVAYSQAKKIVADGRPEKGQHLDRILFEDEEDVPASKEEPDAFAKNRGKFADFMEKPGELEGFLAALWDNIQGDYDPANQEDGEPKQKSETEKRLASHPFVLGAAITVGKNSGDLSRRNRSTIIATIRKNELAFKELYADVMHDADIGFEVRSERKAIVGPADIKNPRLRGWNDMTLGERTALLNRIRDKKVRDAIESDGITDRELAEYIGRLEGDRAKLALKEKQLAHGSEKNTGLYDALKSAREESRLAVRMVSAEIRALYRIKEMRSRLLADIFTPPPKKGMTYEYKAKIRVIQDYLRAKRWEVEPTEAGGYRRTGRIIEPAAAGAVFTQLLRETPDLAKILTANIVNMINDLPVSDWSVADLEALQAAIESLRRAGRMEYNIKESARKAVNFQTRKAIARAVRKLKGYKEPSATGSEEEKALIRGLNEKHLSSFSTMNMDHFARHYLDRGDPRRLNWSLLVGEERDHFRKKMSEVDRRVSAVKRYMVEHKMKPQELYRKITVQGAGPRDTDATFTASDLMMAMLALRDDDSRKAFVYGNLFDAQELKNNEVSVLKVMAQPRVGAVIMAIQRELTHEEQGLAETIGADFKREFDRINKAVISMTEEELRAVENYVPIRRVGVYFDNFSDEIVQDLFARNNISAKTSPNKSHTKERIRIGIQNQTPMRLDLWGSFIDAVDKQEHLIEYGEYHNRLKAVYVSRQSSEVLDAIKHTLGQHGIDYLNAYIAEVANPIRYKDRDYSEKLVRRLRGNLAVGYLAFRWSSVANQLITSPLPFLAYAPGGLFGAAAQVLGGPKNFIEEVENLSVVLRHRQIDPAYEQIKHLNQEGWEGVTKRIGEVGMKGLAWADRWSVAIGWKAVYDKAFAKTQDQEAAIIEADNVVLKCQPSARGVDLSPLFRDNNDWKRIVTQFGAQLNVVWQQLRFDLPEAVAEKRFGEAIGIAVAMSFSGLGLGVLRKLRGKDDDDNERWWDEWLYYATSQSLDAVPLVGSAVSGMMKRLITGDRQIFRKDETFPVVDGIINGVEGIANGNLSGIKELAEAIGLATGLPTLAVEEYLGWMVKRIEGE